MLERFYGKGGWTFIKLTGEIIMTGKALEMMKISDSINDFAFQDKHLLPMGNGYVFFYQLPNRSEKPLAKKKAIT